MQAGLFSRFVSNNIFSMKADFIRIFRESLLAEALLKCTLSRPTSTAASELKNIFIRPVMLKKGLHLAFNHRYQTRDEVKNYLPEEGIQQPGAVPGKRFLECRPLCCGS
ncbi:MAG: hypothetical protein IPL65_00220 [Lewinellaceae bacterium]|nr:hypothetical protein [Lewinellaceae bacterium]